MRAWPSYHGCEYSYRYVKALFPAFFKLMPHEATLYIYKYVSFLFLVFQRGGTYLAVVLTTVLYCVIVVAFEVMHWNTNCECMSGYEMNQSQ